MSSPTDLKNPGQEAAKETDFDTYPDPREFLRHGGIAGVSYLYVLSANCARAQSKGWDQINGMPHFTVRGHSMTIMAKGRPSLTSQPGTVRAVFFLDPDATAATGLELSLQGKPVQPKPPIIKRSPTPTTPPSKAS